VTNAFISPDIPVMIQGITGREGRRHTRNMRAYGTNIVAGVSPNQDEVDGIPVFRSAVDAARVTGARAAVAIVPPLSVLAVVLDAIEAGLSHIVTLAEGVPVHDAVRARQAAREAGLCWLGPSTPGLAIPNRTKLGFIPNVSLAIGDLGIMSKSGTLSYEVCHRLVQQGLGQSLWVGLGGDAVKGMRFADVLPYFQRDPRTRAIVVIGEIGGDEEEELAAVLRTSENPKSVFALVAGSASREGVTMGHAGALVHGKIGTVASKTAALVAAGAEVFSRISDLVRAVKADSSREAIAS
jgi:succinyl-CoA synthetase alpha subunit